MRSMASGRKNGTNGTDGAADDALLNASECAALGRVSRSTWSRLVKRGVAPQPVPLPIQAHRWRRSVVLRFWGLAAPVDSGS